MTHNVFGWTLNIAPSIYVGFLVGQHYCDVRPAVL